MKNMETLNLLLRRKWKTPFLKLTLCFLLAFLSQGIASEDTCREKELRIILIGKTGSGKSATGNAILGKMAFKSEQSFLSVTKTTAYITAWRFRWKLVVVDTPGLADLETSLNEREVLTEITKAYTLASPGPHAFVMLIQPNRFTKEDQYVLNAYTTLFGKEFEKYVVILFTDKKKLQKQPSTSLEEIINVLPKDHPLKKLLKVIKYRYLAIEYTTNYENETDDVIKLLEVIEKMKQENSPSFFTTKLSWLTEVLYDLVGYCHEDDCNYDKKRDEARQKIFEMFLNYANMIAVIVFALWFFHGYAIPVAIAILEILIKLASF